MRRTICFIVVCAALHAGASKNRPENSDTSAKTSLAGGITGFGLEILLKKFEYIDRKLLELNLELHKHREDIGQNISVILEQQTVLLKRSQLQAKLLNLPSSCKDVSSNVSGMYLIRVNNDSAPFKVYCEQEKFGGGWIVVQHRFDGSVDFNRSWIEYREGFGDLDNEFWLGLEKMHEITSARSHEIIFEVKDFEDYYGFARYSAFKLGSESEHYSLKTLGSYSGTAGDSMSTYSEGAKFSTRDWDNDPRSEIHFGVYFGPWWHGYNGGYSNLNGVYKNAIDQKSIWWYDFKLNQKGLSFSRMMVRELQ